MSDECLMKQETVVSFYVVYQAVMRKFTLAGKSSILLKSRKRFNLLTSALALRFPMPKYIVKRIEIIVTMVLTSVDIIIKQIYFFLVFKNGHINNILWPTKFFTQPLL